ncbi:MAG: hypothetical protein Kow0074_06650 [Candidatus Zixiibacteriota bacterium]
MIIQCVPSRCGIGLLVGVLLLTLSGCSDDDEPPLFAITGTVVDGDGAPVAAAHVSLSYEWIFEDGSAKATSSNKDNDGALTIPIAFTLSEESIVTLTILNYRGETVDTLIDHESRGSGLYTITWDGTGDDGNRVSDGVYYTHLVVDDATLDTPLIIAAMCEGMMADDAYLTVTDAEGRFSLEMEWIPFGEEFPATNEVGDVIGQLVFGGGVDVCAWKDTRFGTVAVETSPNQTKDVEIVIE